MKVNFQLSTAIDFALKHHPNKETRKGEMFHEYLTRMMMKGRNDDQKIVLMLHRILSVVSAGTLQEAQFDDRIIRAVVNINKLYLHSWKGKEDWLAKMLTPESYLEIDVAIILLKEIFDLSRVRPLERRDIDLVKTRYAPAYKKIVAFRLMGLTEDYFQAVNQIIEHPISRTAIETDSLASRSLAERMVDIDIELKIAENDNILFNRTFAGDED